MSVAERENREAHSREIALVGLGAMGLPMALNLLAAGHRVTSRSGDAGRTARFAQAGGVVLLVQAVSDGDGEYFVDPIRHGQDASGVPGGVPDNGHVLGVESCGEGR